MLTGELLANWLGIITMCVVYANEWQWTKAAGRSGCRQNGGKVYIGSFAYMTHIVMILVEKQQSSPLIILPLLYVWLIATSPQDAALNPLLCSVCVCVDACVSVCACQKQLKRTLTAGGT